jgi:hypothetical protein
LAFAAISVTPNVATTTSSGITATKSTNSLNQGLVGYWTMDNRDIDWTSATAGTIRDRSGNGNTGTLNGMGKATSSVAGKVGQAVGFRGNSSIDVGDYSWGNGENFSISEWTYTSTSTTMVVFGKGAWEYDILQNYGGNLGAYTFIYYNSSGSETINVSGFGGKLNQWNHFSLTFDGSVAKMYVNGILGETKPKGIGTWQNRTNAATIGQGYINNGFPFIGKIDDVRVYNRALSATEVKQLYNQTAGSKMSASPNVATTTSSGITATKSTNSLNQGLVGYWTMDNRDIDWTNNKMIDRSGNGNTGTLIGLGKATSTVQGRVGQAMKFDKVGTKVNVPSMAFTAGTNVRYSVSAWVKPNTGGPIAAATSESWNTFRMSLSLLAIYVYGDGTHYHEFYYPFKKGTWYHVAVTYDVPNSKSVLYINGVKDEMAGAANPDRAFGSIGGFTNNEASKFDGMIDDVRIYNRVLTAAEIKALYNQGR